MRKIHITTLLEVAPRRLPGYMDAVRARGRAEGDVIILNDDDFDDLRRKYQVPGIAIDTTDLLAKQRFELCKSCGQSKDSGFGCVHHIGCCFGQWRCQPAHKCYEGKW